MSCTRQSLPNPLERNVVGVQWREPDGTYRTLLCVVPRDSASVHINELLSGGIAYRLDKNLNTNVWLHPNRASADAHLARLSEDAEFVLTARRFLHKSGNGVD